MPDPVCWTEAPEELKYLHRQRNRWHRGLFDSLWIHKKMLFNPKYGSIGMVSLPYFWLIELAGPVVELCGYLFVILSFFLGGIYIEMALLFFLLSVLIGSLSSMGAVILEEWSLRKYPKISDIVKLFGYSLTETLWYRPLTVVWRCQGLIQAIRGKKSWGEMKRKGISGEFHNEYTAEIKETFLFALYFSRYRTHNFAVLGVVVETRKRNERRDRG